jgi:hypothetical protein
MCHSQTLTDPPQRGDVEVIGWLVAQEQVAALLEHHRQVQPVALAACDASTPLSSSMRCTGQGASSKAQAISGATFGRAVKLRFDHAGLRTACLPDRR